MNCRFCKKPVVNGVVLHSECYESIMDLGDAIRGGYIISLPCRVGDVVYQHNFERIYSSKIKRIIMTEGKIVFDTDGVAFDISAVGHSIFLTEKEAMVALEGSQHGETH